MERNLLFYMANLGSEVGQIFSLRKKGLLIESEDSYNRALGIIERIEKHEELLQFAHRKAEVKSMRDYLLFSMQLENQSGVERQWGKYFMPFMLRQLSLSKII